MDDLLHVFGPRPDGARGASGPKQETPPDGGFDEVFFASSAAEEPGARADGSGGQAPQKPDANLPETGGGRGAVDLEGAETAAPLAPSADASIRQARALGVVPTLGGANGGQTEAGRFDQVIESSDIDAPGSQTARPAETDVAKGARRGRGPMDAGAGAPTHTRDLIDSGAKAHQPDIKVGRAADNTGQVDPARVASRSDLAQDLRNAPDKKPLIRTANSASTPPAATIRDALGAAPRPEAGHPDSVISDTQAEATPPQRHNYRVSGKGVLSQTATPAADAAVPPAATPTGAVAAPKPEGAPIRTPRDLPSHHVETAPPSTRPTAPSVPDGDAVGQGVSKGTLTPLAMGAPQTNSNPIVADSAVPDGPEPGPPSPVGQDANQHLAARKMANSPSEPVAAQVIPVEMRVAGKADTPARAVEASVDLVAGEARSASAVGTAQATPTAFTPGTAHPAHAIAQQVIQALRAQGVEPGALIEVALDPPELGKLRVGVQDGPAGLSLILTAERPETVDLMRRHIALLTEEFGKLGLGAPQVSVGQDDAHGRGPATGGDRNPTLDVSPDDPHDRTPPPDPVARIRLGDAGLDLRL